MLRSCQTKEQTNLREVREKSSPEHEISVDQIYFLVIAIIVHIAGFLLKVIAVLGQDTPVDPQTLEMDCEFH